MSRVIIDAREWQNMFDLKTGKKMDGTGPVVKLVSQVLANHPFPGDMDIRGNQWVTDTAMDLIGKYAPRLVCLTYAQQYFTDRYTLMTAEEREKLFTGVFTEVRRFIDESGYAPVIIGTGDMTELAGEMDLTRLDGLAFSTHWSARYAGLHNPTPKDLSFVASLPGMARVVSRREWIETFDGVCPDPARLPDYLLVAKPGWTFRTMGVPLRRPVRIPDESFSIPLATALGSAGKITEIRNLIEANLSHKKIALIIIEGVGVRDFSIPHTLCDNGKDWYYYEPGDGQYLTITTGTHQVFAYPSGYRYFDLDGENKAYPFSGYFTGVPGNTIGSGFPGRSIAVGNRSMLMHMAFGTDISIECFARNLFNQGCMAVIHDENKF